MVEIKLFVSCHEAALVPEHPLLVPIQVGAALSRDRFSGFLHDDTGENISTQNRSYCELTAQYWAWKNVRAAYYGLFHYRRYLYPDVTAKRPYRIEGTPTKGLLVKLGYESFAGLISQYDLLLPIGEDMHIPVREHYARAPCHFGKDLDMVESIVQELHPEYASAMEEYLSGTVCYFGNIFIMERAAFQAYSAWLFSILEEFDRRAGINGYSPQELRVDGYLAERLLGVWATHHKELRRQELPRVHFVEDDAERRKKQFINLLLPPGSLRRSVVKKAVR